MTILRRFLTSFGFGSKAEVPESLIEGGLYSTQNENGAYSVLKILKLDPHGVHVRLYSNQFAERPTNVNVAELYMAGIDRQPHESLGMGHTPISRHSFATWRTRFIATVPVGADELEGYEVWAEARGGYF